MKRGVRARTTGEGAPPRVLYAVTAPITAVGFLHGQLAFLAGQGFDVHLACGAAPEVEELAAREGVTFHDVPLSRTWLAGDDLRGIVRAVRVLRRTRPDVLNYSTLKASLVWALAALVAGRPRLVVYLLRGLRLEGARPWSPGFCLLWLADLFSARVADTVLCVSHGVRRRALALRLARPERAVVLDSGSSNGVDALRFAPSAGLRRLTRERLRYTENDPVVGFVGRLTEDKGIYDLLDALREVRSDVRLLLVGPVEPDIDVAHLRAQYPDLASRLTHVEHTRSVEEYYAAMDVLVLPSHREGLSNALLEAQAMQLACVTTDATGCVDAVEPGVTALVVPRRAPRELAKAIEELLSDPARRRVMGRAGRRRVLEEFVPEKLWARYAELYRTAVGGSGTQKPPPTTSPLPSAS